MIRCRRSQARSVIGFTPVRSETTPIGKSSLRSEPLSGLGRVSLVISYSPKPLFEAAGPFDGSELNESEIYTKPIQ
jgi:hypothetical protein